MKLFTSSISRANFAECVDPVLRSRTAAGKRQEGNTPEEETIVNCRTAKEYDQCHHAPALCDN